MVSFVYANVIFEKKPLYPTYIPGVDPNNVKFFWIIFVYQIPEIFIASFILLSYIHSTLSFIVFGIAQIQILNHKIGLLSLTDVEHDLAETTSTLNPVGRQKVMEKRLRENLISCIKFHLEIKRFVVIQRMNFN